MGLKCFKKRKDLRVSTSDILYRALEIWIELIRFWRLKKGLEDPNDFPNLNKVVINNSLTLHYRGRVLTRLACELGSSLGIAVKNSDDKMYFQMYTNSSCI